MDSRWSKPLMAALISLGVSFSSYADNLLDVYWVAEKQDPQLRSAEAARQGARQRERQSVATLLPQVQLKGRVSDRNSEIGNIKNDASGPGYDVSLVQPIYRDADWKQLNQTKALVRQADAQFEAVQRNLMTRVADRYLAVLAAGDDLETVRAEKEAVGRQLEQTKQRFEVGLIAITDVHEAQAAYDLTVAAEIAAENNLSNAREALREVTGQYHENLRPLGELKTDPPDPPDVKWWVDTALANNQALISAQAGVDAARYNIGRQRAGHLPYLDLLGSYSYDNDAGDIYRNESQSTSSIMLQLTVPVFEGGGTQARVKESQYQYDQALETLELQRRDIQRQVSAAFLNVNSTISRVKALGQAVISTESALKASEAGLEVGTRTTLDVLQTRRSLFAAQRDQLRARYEYIINLLRLREAAGTLSMADFERVNGWLK